MVSYGEVEIVVVYANVSLNPCCSGRWSRTYRVQDLDANHKPVLILVVVEDGLVQGKLKSHV